MRSIFHRFRLFQQAREPLTRVKPRINPIQATTMAGSMTAALAYTLASISTPSALGDVPEDVAEKKHHVKNGVGFVNPWESYKDFVPAKVFKDMVLGGLTGKITWPSTEPPTVPVIVPSFLPRRETKALRATWLGHACYYIEFPGGLRVLFDPVFEDRCSPFSYLGPKRYTKIPCELEEIPIVDVVVISHSHYDHLSHPTILALHKAHPKAQFMVGLGLKKWFKECGIENVVEMDWWTDVDLKLSPSTGEKSISDATSTAAEPAATSSTDITARISCLPCQHTSARTPFDKNHTLWCSWAVTSGGKSVWFGGDTGYRAVPKLPEGEDDYGEAHKDLPWCPAFKEIGTLRGPFDLGLIPIGAYDPRYIMSAMHANPFDSVNIFIDTKCKRAMGIHWGTWVLTTEKILEPPKLLKKALAWKGIQEEGVFDVCDIGESREF